VNEVFILDRAEILERLVEVGRGQDQRVLPYLAYSQP
jgi:hypothetical protein